MPERITVVCPECAASLSAPSGKPGRRLRCPKCCSAVLLPSAATQPAPRELNNIEQHSMRKAADVAFSGSQSFQRFRTSWWTSKRIVVIGAGVLTFATIVAMLTTNVGQPNPRQAMANRIRSIEEEALEDPEFVKDLTMINNYLITQIRTLAIASDLQFSESYLGHCDGDLTTVVFERTEATYFIDAQINRDRSFQGYLYPDSSDMCISFPDDRSKLRDGQIIIDDVESAKAALRHGGLAAALLLEPDPAKKGKVKLSVSTLLNSSEVDRLLESAIRGAEIDITYDCGSISCQIWTLGSANLRFRRL